MNQKRIADTLTSLENVFAADPSKGPATYSAATAIVTEGLRCRVGGDAGEELETDMPVSMGGSGSRPNPGWYFRATMAACCATMIASRAARKGIELTHLEVKVTGKGNHRGMLGMDDKISAGHTALFTNVRIGARGASVEELRALVQWADDHSPVGCTVRGTPENSLSIEIV